MRPPTDTLSQVPACFRDCPLCRQCQSATCKQFPTSFLQAVIAPRLCLPVPACLQVEAVKPQVAQARSTGSPITIQLQEAFYNVSVPLHIDVTNPVHINIPVTITGQGPDKTVLDCGYVWRAISILGAGAVSVSNLTIQNCQTIMYPRNMSLRNQSLYGEHTV